MQDIYNLTYKLYNFLIILIVLPANALRFELNVSVKYVYIIYFTDSHLTSCRWCWPWYLLSWDSWI